MNPNGELWARWWGADCESCQRSLELYGLLPVTCADCGADRSAAGWQELFGNPMQSGDPMKASAPEIKRANRDELGHFLPGHDLAGPGRPPLVEGEAQTEYFLKHELPKLLKNRKFMKKFYRIGERVFGPSDPDPDG